MKCGQHFMLSVSFFARTVVCVFFLWSGGNIFMLSVLIFEINVVRHFKLSACCPVIRSCPHFINTPKMVIFPILKLVLLFGSWLNIIWLIKKTNSITKSSQWQEGRKTNGQMKMTIIIFALQFTTNQFGYWWNADNYG